MKKILFFIVLCLPTFLLAQTEHSTQPEQIARQYLAQHLTDWGLTPNDISNVSLNSKVLSKHNQVTTLYFNQQFNGLDLHNAIYNVSILPSGKVLIANNRFFKNIQGHINTTTASYSSDQALQIVLSSLGLSTDLPATLERANTKVKYNKENISFLDISSSLKYFPKGDQYRLVWEIVIEPNKQHDLWQIMVDAQTGTIIDKQSLTSKCSFSPQQFTRTNADNCVEIVTEETTQTLGPDGASYNVFPYYIEGPTFGSRQTLTDPAQLSASPYGWHDTNGADGAEYTITRGNNVHAYLDLQDIGISQGDEPDGGNTLNFNFPFNINAEASANRKMAVTQLFYMNNFMHDFSFQYGFDEEAGNYQQKNYNTNLADANDYVQAEGQDGSATGTSNNAYFSSPADGGNGHMSMFTWVGQGAKDFTILSPAGIAGSYLTGSADFGPEITSIPVSGDIILVNSGATLPTEGCNSISQDLTDKIALVDRGTCYFAEKAINAQDAGAIGLIIVNFENNTINMTAPANLSNLVTIPVVMLTSSNGDLIKSYINNGSVVSASIVKGITSGPDSLDSDLDNGVMAHEYGHGISNRLTGGRLSPSCLSNKENMGEGWSDFFTLAVSAKATDDGTEARGIGNYVTNLPTTGPGIRIYPYSTDMSINPHTYYDILYAETHDLGETWTACIWDMYWLFVEQYGFDEDIYNGTGGNNIAIQLVFDGMKLQPCSPGFVDGRDAILAADMANNNGANQCLIWKAFARRGLGVGASQGSSTSIGDGLESYEIPPSCTNELFLKKSVTESINPGDTIQVSLHIGNYKGTDLTGVTVSDIIPEGTHFITGSASIEPAISSATLSFDLGDMTNQSDLTITYQLTTDLDHATKLWADDFETTDAAWDQESIDGDNYWDWEFSNLITYGQPHSGNRFFYIEGEYGSSDQSLLLIDPINISGTKPIMRFFHSYDTKAGEDGGIVEISTDGGTIWADLQPNIFRNDYTGKIKYSTFVIPNQKAFWGTTPTDDPTGYMETMIDLSSYIGDDIQIRFHFATGSDSTDEKSLIWAVDDVEFQDMLNYNSEACVTTNEGDQICSSAPSNGTVVSSFETVGINETIDPSIGFKVSPNPAGDFINVNINSTQKQDASIYIFGIDGKKMQQLDTKLRTGKQSFTILTEQIPPGIYFVKIQTEKGLNVQKLIIN